MNISRLPSRIHLALLTSLAILPPAFGFELVGSEPFAPGVNSTPRLGGTNDVATRINAALQEIDETNLANLTCSDESLATDAAVEIKVLAAGPEFLSLHISSGGSCAEAAHPFWDERVVTFDLHTGDPADLSALLPEGWKADGDPDDALRVLYFGAASAYFLQPTKDQFQDCVGPYAMAARNDWLTFDLAIDATKRGLFMMPRGLLFPDTYCANSVVVPLEALEGSGFDPRFIAAFGPAPTGASP